MRKRWQRRGPRATGTARRSFLTGRCQEAGRSVDFRGPRWTRGGKAMTNPFTYCELHSKDAKKARAFYGALFDWKLDPFPVPGREYHAVDAGEGHAGGLTEETFEGVSGWLTYV